MSLKQHLENYPLQAVTNTFLDALEKAESIISEMQV
jgi:hypothetical protein